MLFSQCAHQPEIDLTESNNSEIRATTSSAKDGQSAEQTYQFTDVPVPSKFKLDRERSFIYEAGTFKAGAITYTGWSKIEALVNFYKNEMSDLGWEIISTFNYKDVTLIFAKVGWNCTVRISHRRFGGSKIEIQIGPVDSPGPA